MAPIPQVKYRTGECNPCQPIPCAVPPHIPADVWVVVLASAKQDRLEGGATVRLDSTVTAALMHEPSDSMLLSVKRRPEVDPFRQ